MARRDLRLGTGPNTPGADTLYEAFSKVRQNEIELFEEVEAAKAALAAKADTAALTALTARVAALEAGGAPTPVTAGAPQSIVLASPSATTITLNWSAPATGTGPFTYDTRHRVVGATTWTEALGVTTPRSITVSAGTNYETQVRAIGTNGTPGPWTASTPASIQTAAAPEPPVTLPNITATPTSRTFTEGGSMTSIALSAVPAGATRTLSPNDGRLVFNGDQTQLVRGLSAWTPSTVVFTITDTHPNATNSPRTATVTITVEAAVAGGPATLHTFTVDGPGNAEGYIQTETVIFPEGQVPAGTVIGARTGSATGPLIRCQADVADTHPDGSIKQMLLAFELPARTAGTVTPILLRAGEAHASPGANIDPAAFLSGRTASLTITPDAGVGGSPWSMDPHATSGREIRRAGPLVYEFRRMVDVPASATGAHDTTITNIRIGNVDSARAVVDVLLHKSGHITHHFSIRNDKFNLQSGVAGAMRPYTLTHSIDGVQRVSVAPDYDNKAGTTYAYPMHGIGAWLARTARSGPGGAAIVDSSLPRVMFDVDRYVQMGVLPQQDRTMGWNAAAATAMANLRSGADWNKMWHHRGLTWSMGQAGGALGIGLLTEISSAAILGMPEAYWLTFDQAEGMMGIPWHWWDTPNSSWLNTIDNPNGHVSPTWATASYLNNQVVVQGSSPWTQDQGHQPQGHHVPLLLSGRRDIAEAQAAQNARNMFGTNPDTGRGYSTTADTTQAKATRLAEIKLDGRGVNMLGSRWPGQVRGYAWSTRSLHCAALTVPGSLVPGHPEYFTGALVGQQAWLLSKTPDWTAEWGEVRGIPTWEYGGTGYPYYAAAPWQVDFLTQTLAWMARADVPHVRDYLRWSLPFAAGRHLAKPASNWDPRDGSVYNMIFAIPLNGTRVKTWAEVSALLDEPVGAYQSFRHIVQGSTYVGPNPDSNTFRKGSAGATIDGNYGRHASAALALLADVFPDDPDVARAFFNWHVAFDKTTGMVTTAAWQANARENWTRTGVTRAPGVRPRLLPKAFAGFTEDAEPGQAIAVIPYGRGANDTTDSGIPETFSIVGGAGASTVSIDNAGVLTLLEVVNSTTTPTIDVEVSAANAAGAVLATQSYSIPVIQVPLAITGPASFDVMASRPVGYVVWTGTIVGHTTSISLTGNTGGHYAVARSGNVLEITVATALPAVGTVRNLAIAATGPAGTANHAVTGTVVASTTAPVVADNQNFEIAEGTTFPRATTPQALANTGGAIANATIEAGPFDVSVVGGEARFASNQALWRTDAASVTRKVTLGNAAQSGIERNAVFSIIQPGILRSAAPSVTWINLVSSARRVLDSHGEAPIARIYRPSGTAQFDVLTEASGGQRVANEADISGFVSANPWDWHTLYDQTGRGMHYTNPNVAQLPIGHTGGAGQFNRIGDRVAMVGGSRRLFQQTPYAELPGVAATGILGCYVVGRTGATGGNFELLTTNLGYSGMNIYLGTANSSGNYLQRVRMNNGGQDYTGEPIPPNTNFVMYFRWNANGGAQKHRLTWNDKPILAAAGSGSAAVLANIQFYLMGSASAGTWNGSFAEAGIFSALDVSGSQEADLIAAVRAGFGI